jgi:histone acetyltransferase 1
MDLTEEWTVSSNEAVTIRLEDEDSGAEFKPAFTYVMYDTPELIYGYKDLRIEYVADSYTMLPFASMSYSAKIQGIELPDPLEVLMEKASDDIYTNRNAWERSRLQERETFSIPGKLINETDISGETYQVYKTPLREAKSLHSRLEIFVLFFIEGGSEIDQDDERWDLYLVYKKAVKGGDAQLCGFSTTYRYFWYESAAEHDRTYEAMRNSRKRISQFLILPPYQGRSLGTFLYKSIVDALMADESVKEITVELPSEAFDDLRDRCDLERLSALGVWSEVTLPVDRQWVERTRREYKIAPRQFDRCVEMALLHSFHGAAPSREYRLFVKQRLYQRNYEVLKDMEMPEQRDKLATTYDRLTEDYQRIISKVRFATDPKGKKRGFGDVE